jgi:hypothetical protein
MRFFTLLLVILVHLSLNAQNMGIKLPVSNLPNATLDVNGSTAFREGTALSLTNPINDNVALSDYSFYRIIGATAAFSITGFDNGQNGRMLFLINATSFNMTFNHQSGTSTAANQINTGTGTSLTIGANGMATLMYNSTLQKWVVLSKSGEKTDWSLTGNTSTNPGTHFIGTTDAQDLIFKTNSTERMRIQNGGTTAGVDVANHLAAGASANLETYNTVSIDENYSEVPTQTSIGLKIKQIRTEATPTASSILYGIDATATYRMNGNTSTGSGSGIKGEIVSDGNYGFNSLMGGNFTATTTANSGAQRQLIGAFGYSQIRGNANVTEATGLYGDVTTTGTGTINEAAGVKGWSFLNTTGTFTTSIGVRGGSGKIASATGSIGTGIGVYADSYNATLNYGLLSNAYVTIPGTYANTYGAYVSAYPNHASATLTNAYGTYSTAFRSAGIVRNSYAGYFNASGATNNNYGVYSFADNTATNNYAFYGEVDGGANTDWGMFVTGEDKNYLSGYLGLGTINPVARLHIVSDGAGTNNDLRLDAYNNADDPSLSIRRGRGTEASPTNLVNGDRMGGLNYWGQVNSTMTYLSSIQGVYKGNGLTTLSNLAFFTSNNERMVIDENGDVGIGVTAPSHILHINGQGRSTNAAWATTSDIRLKNIDKPFEYGLKELIAINTYRFHYKENNALKLPTDKGFQGVMAQELQKVIPEAVIKQADGYFTVNTDPVFWTMLNSVKEINTASIKLKAESDALKSESLIQKEELEKLKRENELLKKSLEKTNKDIEAIKAMLEKKQN